MGEAADIFVILLALFTLKVYHLLSPWEGPGALTTGRSDSSCFWEWEMRWQSSGVLWGPGRRGGPWRGALRGPLPISALSWLAFCLPVLPSWSLHTSCFSMRCLPLQASDQALSSTLLTPFWGHGVYVGSFLRYCTEHSLGSCVR